MELKNSPKNKLGTLLCINTVLLGGFIQTFGATETVLDLSGTAERQDKQHAPVKRYIIGTGNSYGLGLGSACGFYSLEAALQIALNPEKEFLTVQKKSIESWYQQYAKVLEEYFPIIRSVVSPSFRIDGDFFAKFYNLSSFDELGEVAQFATKENLNVEWKDSLTKISDKTSKDKDYEKKFYELAKLYYGKRNPLEDYLEFRQVLFAQWIALVIGEFQWLDIEEGESEVPGLLSQKWEEHCREDSCNACDIQEQERMYHEGVKFVQNCDFGVCAWSYFFMGMIASCNGEMLCDNFTINIFSLESNEREVRFMRSFFDPLDDEGNKKIGINIVFSAGHVECLTPDDRLRWITYSDVCRESQYAELIQDTNRWKDLCRSLRRAKEQKNIAQEEAINLCLGEFQNEMKAKRPVENSLVAVPIPVLIVDEKNENIQKKYPSYLTKTDIPEKWQDNKSCIMCLTGDEEMGIHDRVEGVRITENYFSLLSRMVHEMK